MNLSIKKRIIWMSLVFICGTSCLAAQAQAFYLQSRMKAHLSDIQFIMNNEIFVFQGVELEEGDGTPIRSCVYESESAFWIIHYCEDIAENLLEKPWHLFLAGHFSIKNSEIQLDYYLERESNIYRNLEYGSLAFTRNLDLMRVHLIDGDTTVDIGWSKNRQLFLQTLARIQEQYIEQVCRGREVS